jgi:PPOX class probable F420-dependent enzyme
MADEVTTLAARKFVTVTTFKKSGDAVAAPMWIGRDGDDLFVWTPADSWKVKRVRNNPRVTLVPCGRFGKPDEGAQPVDGTAHVVTDPATVERLTKVIQRKYGLEFHVVTFIERLAARGRRTPRVILRIAV